MALCAGFGAMAIAAGAFVYRFWRENRALALSADLNELEGSELDPNELAEVNRIYRLAVLHAPFAEGRKDLGKCEKRADELERDALYTADSLISKRRLLQVARMRAEIERAKERAKVVVVRRRMNHALNDLGAASWAAVFVLGLVGFAVAADRLESERSGKIATAKSCAEARTAHALENKLPAICK